METRERVFSCLMEELIKGEKVMRGSSVIYGF